MKRILLYITAVLLGATCASGQTIAGLFASMPDSIVPVMSKNNRLDCIDFFNSKMTSNVQNNYNGKSSIEEMTDTYLLVHPTSRSKAEMKLYTAGDGHKIIAVAYTYISAASETVLRFYSDQWKPLDAGSLIAIPSPDELTRQCDTLDAGHQAKAMALLQSAYKCASINKDSGDITFALSTSALTADEQSAATPCMAGPLKFAWNGKKFEKQQH